MRRARLRAFTLVELVIVCAMMLLFVVPAVSTSARFIDELTDPCSARRVEASASSTVEWFNVMMRRAALEQTNLRFEIAGRSANDPRPRIKVTFEGASRKSFVWSPENIAFYMRWNGNTDPPTSITYNHRFRTFAAGFTLNVYTLRNGKKGEITKWQIVATPLGIVSLQQRT